MQDKEYRRHQEERIRKKRKGYWGDQLKNSNQWLGHLSLRDRQAREGKKLNTPNNCSCWICKNPRKSFKGKNKEALPIREISNSEAFVKIELAQEDDNQY